MTAMTALMYSDVDDDAMDERRAPVCVISSCACGANTAINPDNLSCIRPVATTNHFLVLRQVIQYSVIG